MNPAQSSALGWLRTLAHVVMAIAGFSALVAIFTLGLTRPVPGTPLSGELLTDHAFTTLSLFPATVGLAILTVFPYRRFCATAGPTRVIYFHVLEGASAAALVCFAAWLIGPETLRVLF